MFFKTFFISRNPNALGNFFEKLKMLFSKSFWLDQYKRRAKKLKMPDIS